MSSERRHERSRCRRRALVLLAVYALFVLLPAAHLMVHDHDGGPLGPLVPADQAGGPTSLCAGCGDGCENPFHSHDGHGVHHPCAVCRVQGSTNGLLVVPVGAVLALVPVGHVAPTGSEQRSVPQSRGPSVRGPPQSFAATRFETLVA